jgi:hypothetical protein
MDNMEGTNCNNTASVLDMRREAADQHREAEALTERYRQMVSHPATPQEHVNSEDLKWALERPKFSCLIDANKEARLYSVRVKVSDIGVGLERH